MYRVGDRVKVFMDCFSLHTEKGIIYNVKFLPDKNKFIYLVALDNGEGGVVVGEESIICLTQRMNKIMLEKGDTNEEV